jgi:hypothetical protein
MELELFDLVVSAVLAAVFVLLLVGVYPARQRENNLNLVKHGFLSASATVVTLVFVFWVMVPAFGKFMVASSDGGLFSFPFVLLHSWLGAVSIGLAIAVVVAWVRRPLGELGCAKLGG